MKNVSQVATSATSTTVVLPSMGPPLFSPNALAAAVAQAIGNMLLDIISALQSSNSQPVSIAPSPVLVSNSSGYAATSAPPPSSLAQAGVSGLASGASRIQVPFIPTFMPLLATSLLSSFSLVASSMSPMFAIGRSLPKAPHQQVRSAALQCHFVILGTRQGFI